MLVYAAIDFASLLALVIGVVGLAGVVFTALRFRRDDTTAVVDQQYKITQEMKTLVDTQTLALCELRSENARLRSELEQHADD